MGLSPHGRGNRVIRLDGGSVQGSIPARAGEPFTALLHKSVRRVYPRTGGGTVDVGAHHVKAEGLSPHGRGNHRGARGDPVHVGSIPARAGEPTRRPTGAQPCRVYPRTGGGTETLAVDARIDAGLSPHGRGNPDGSCRSAECDGSIPARAGEPDRRTAANLPMWVYPRTGGGTDICESLDRLIRGLSPHGRGNPS